MADVIERQCSVFVSDDAVGLVAHLERTCVESLADDVPVRFVVSSSSLRLLSMRTCCRQAQCAARENPYCVDF